MKLGISRGSSVVRCRRSPRGLRLTIFIWQAFPTLVVACTEIGWITKRPADAARTWVDSEDSFSNSWVDIPRSLRVNSLIRVWPWLHR